MGSVVKGIVGAVSSKRGAKRAYQAQQRGINRAIGEQEGILSDITKSQTDLRDTNISDIKGLAQQTSSEYDDVFGYLGDVLQRQNDQTSALQQGAYASNEERLLASFDDIINRSQQSFDYAQKNLMPFISKGMEAFNKYQAKAQEGFEFKPFEEQFQSPKPFEYGDFKSSQEPFRYDDFNFNYQESPDYQFIKNQALNSATNSQAAQGMGLSGATLKALQDRAAGLASTDYANQFNRAMQEYQYDRGADYNQYLGQYNRELGEYQYDRGADYTEHLNNYNQAQQEFAQRYNIDRANETGAYQNYLNDLNTLSGLGNVGLQGVQDMAGRERDMANFEVEARSSLSNALAQNDLARAESEINNILRLTGGQGELAMQAMQARNQIKQFKTQNVIDQRTTAQSNINNTRANTGSNIANLEIGKGQAEANYQTQRAALQGQLISNIADAGFMAASATAGGAGAFGGAGGLTGAMQGMNFGSEMSNFGGGSTFSPNAMNFVNTGSYSAPKQNNMSLGGSNYGMASYPQMFSNSAGTGNNWLGGF